MSARSDYLAYLTAQSFAPNRAVLFEEGAGTPVEYYTNAPVTLLGSPGWDIVSGYVCGKAASTDDSWTIDEPSSNFLGDSSNTNAQTVLFIRNKRDSTLRQPRA